MSPIKNNFFASIGVSRRGGFSLVEVLITLVIMSIGMLSIAGLYVKSMQAGRTSMFHHHAVTLASDVADRVRANPTAGIAYDHLSTETGTDNSCVTGTVTCNSAAMAANDIFIWQNQAQASLPNGSVAVLFTAGAPGIPPTYQITVAWNEPGLTSTSAPPTSAAAACSPGAWWRTVSASSRSTRPAGTRTTTSPAPTRSASAPSTSPSPVCCTIEGARFAR